jgi:hypothetical protein
MGRDHEPSEDGIRLDVRGRLSAMTEIERAYHRRLAQWSGQQRIARCESLLAEVRSMIRRRVADENPDLDDRALDIRVAYAMYGSDRRARELLGMLDR